MVLILSAHFFCWSNTWIGGGLLLSPWYFLSFSNFFYGKISGKTNLVRDCFGLCDDVAKMRIRNLNKLRTVSTLLNDKIPGVLLRISGFILYCGRYAPVSVDNL